VKPPKRTFVVHGEAAAATSFAELLRTQKNWTVDVPEPGQRFKL
jgi:predicted metal-dependent RNase